MHLSLELINQRRSSYLLHTGANNLDKLSSGDNIKIKSINKMSTTSIKQRNQQNTRKLSTK